MPKQDPFEPLRRIAKLDANREARVGIPEAVLAEGKRTSDLKKIVQTLAKKKTRGIVTRLSKENYADLWSVIEKTKHTYSADARVLILNSKKPKKSIGTIGILTAGTADIPVAEEARFVAEELGCKVEIAYDVGIAGLHRLEEPLRRMVSKKARALIVVAGMEGALPSVVSGLTSIPVLAVPTSVGYGAQFKGVTALTGMLSSCNTLAVFNIDNGFGAAGFAVKMLKLR